MSVGFTPQRIRLAIGRVEGFIDFAADKLSPKQVEDLQIVLEIARGTVTLTSPADFGADPAFGPTDPSQKMSRPDGFNPGESK